MFVTLILPTYLRASHGEGRHHAELLPDFLSISISIVWEDIYLTIDNLRNYMYTAYDVSI